uniref:Putative secreted protein n=1 Tax=Ixodes ricinus TaxID=34613 RepID=A0A6B0U957_IXORI
MGYLFGILRLYFLNGISLGQQCCNYNADEGVGKICNNYRKHSDELETFQADQLDLYRSYILVKFLDLVQLSLKAISSNAKASRCSCCRKAGIGGIETGKF